MSIKKTSNIPTFAIDDLGLGFNNLRPVIYNNTELIETWHIPDWLAFYKIDYRVVDLDHATIDCWYPVSVNFWNLEIDYLHLLKPRVIDLLQKKQLRLLFYYREADDPTIIQRHIDQQADALAIDPGLIFLISGNNSSGHGSRSCFFWHFDVSYHWQNMHSPHVPVQMHPRSRNITCLSRVHKHWREVFVYNLYRQTVPRPNFLSYGEAKYYDTQDDFVLWNADNRNLPGISCLRPLDILLPDQSWSDTLPLRADDLNQEQHNDHSMIVAEHFQDSYWNIVLETLLDVQGSSSGVFVTEKTLKPIRNGQSFVILGCAYTLAFLREHGYKTFDNVIDESYDTVIDVRKRWHRVYEIAKYLMHLDLDSLQSLQEKCLPVISHNQTHFQRSRRQALENLIGKLCRM